MNMKPSAIRWIALLVGVYITLQLIADACASKIIALGDVTMPAGTFVFALTFTWRDLLHKRLGKTWAKAAIWTAAVANIIMALYFQLAIQLPSAPFWSNQDAFASVLSAVPRITFASILAELVSELVDTEVYHFFSLRTSTVNQWMRVLVSNAVSTPIDSALFAIVAFGGTLPAAAMLSVAVGQVLYKFAVAIFSLPLIYFIPEGGKPESNEGPQSVRAVA